MLGHFSGIELAIILIAVVFLFGLGRMGNIKSSLSRGASEFKAALADRDPVSDERSRLDG